MRPVERTAMQVHHRFDVEHVAAHAVNDGAGKAVEVELAVLAMHLAPTSRIGHNAAQCAVELVKEVITRPGCCCSCHSAAASSSSSASRWLTTRMELTADVLNHLHHRAARDRALLDFPGAPVKDLVPLGLGVSDDGVVQPSDEFAGEEHPIFFRQSQHFRCLFRPNVHAAEISACRGALASLRDIQKPNGSRSRLRVGAR